MASAAPDTADGNEESDRIAPTGRGRQSLLSTYCDFSGHSEARQFKRRNVAALYGALVRREGPVPIRDLRPYFRGFASSAPKQGLYTDSEYRAFVDHIGGPILRDLPGIEATGDGFRFVGIDPADHDLDTEYTRPLDAFRSDPRVTARNYLDGLHGPHTDAYEDLLTLWDMVAEAGETTTEELERDYRTPDLSEYGDRLANLPHIEREIEGPPDPADLSTETYEDILEAKRQIEAEPSEIWRFNPDL